MKRNKTYKILTGLTLLTLLTTTVIGSTMANFTSASSLSDSAKVATCTLNVTGSDLFNTKYLSDVTELAQTTTYSIKSDVKTLAPGSKNEIDLKVNGLTEFLVDAAFSLDVELTGDWIDNEGNFYCPIQFKLVKYEQGKDPVVYAVDGASYTSKKDLLDAIKQVIVHHESFKANTAYKDYIPVKVEWKWPFTSSEANNAKDTALTSKATNNPISLTIKCNTQFTQID